MIRLLNFAWHGVVYVPVLIVCVVANLWGADGTMVMLFGSMAFATVSLEICISVIIEKVTYLTALSRQTRRVYKTAQSEAELKLWVEYYNKRHQKARRDTAKAALVTVFSMVIFSCIVGIEGIRLVMHSGPSHAEDVEAEPIYSKVEVFKELGLDDDSLMPIAVSLSTCMFVIACAKLWIQTRHCLEKDDPLDKFATAEAAIASLPEDEADEGRAENLSNGQNVYDVEQN